ncbi:alpha-D-kanosaminyltransferase [Ferrovum sp. JA12]|uniref:glycosyltransferase n=1 Tax=Ferrovum sp. JA12 TaxID=1356299 RepID=UPI000703156E|nr:alpha-D-kanosaminyltransferase [Ferrovum sp. JA12]
MRVLHVYRTYFPDPPGGLQEAIRQISLATSCQGVKNQIFTLSPNPVPETLERPEAQVKRCRSWAAPASCDLGSAKAFKEFARLSRQADVVHYHFPWPFADLLHLYAGSKKPAVMTYHSDIVRQRALKTLYSPLLHRTLGTMDAIVATSPAYAASSPVLADRRYADRVRVIPLGLDEGSYPQQGDDSILGRLGLSADEPYFLFIGVLRYYKGLHYLVEASARVSAKVVIAGAGPEWNNLKNQANALGLDRLIFAGQVSDGEKVSLLRHCRALVLPSHLRSEAFGMVLIEAGMYGKPMVSCEIGSGTSYANADGETGFVVPPANPGAIAVVMNHLLEDEYLAHRFGAEARKRYERLFSGEALGKAYVNLYRSVLERFS